MKSRPAWLWLLPVASGVAFVGLWYLIHAQLGPDRRFMLPAPHEVVAAFAEYRLPLLRAAFNTALGALLGFAAAASVGALLGLLLSVSHLVRASLYPYLMMLQMTPVIVIAPILVLWARPGLTSVSIITFLICFFPIVVNTTQGLIATDRQLVELFRMWRANRRQEIVWLRIPAALPYFFTGLRIAATLAPIGAIVGDFTAGNAGSDGGGLGYLTIIYSGQFKMPALFATAITGFVLGFLMVAGVVVLQWFFLHRWHDAFRPLDR